MNLENLYNVFARLLFYFAFVLFALTFVEVIVNAFDYTILAGTYTKGRLIELSAMMLVFVITLLLRQIRNELKKSTSAE